MNNNSLNFNVESKLSPEAANLGSNASIEKVEFSLKDEKQLAKQDAFQRLEEAFINLNTVDPKKVSYSDLFAKIIGRYGIRVYPQFENSLPYLYASIQLQLQKCGLISFTDFSSIASLKEFEKTQIAFDELIHFITTTNEKSLPEMLKKLTEEQKLQFAETLQYVGHIYLNLKEGHLKMEKKPFLETLSRLFGGVREVLLSLEQTASVRVMLGELNYNTAPSLYLDLKELQGPLTKEDILESFKILDQTLEYNSSVPVKARIANLKACQILKYDVVLAKEFANEALKVW